MQFSDLNFPVSGDNFGGVDRFWFVPVSDIDYVDASRQVVLKAGRVWYLGKATRYSITFTNPSRENRGGTTFRPRLSGTLSKYTPEMAALLAYMRGKRFVVIYKDKNGYLNQVGTKQQPLVFETNQSTGGNPDSKNGVTFNFSGESKIEPVHYIREVVVSDGGSGEAVPFSEPFRVYMNDQLLVSGQSGGEIRFRSQFSFQFDIT